VESSRPAQAPYLDRRYAAAHGPKRI
jgi:hypothetical protein